MSVQRDSLRKSKRRAQKARASHVRRPIPLILFPDAARAEAEIARLNSIDQAKDKEYNKRQRGAFSATYDSHMLNTRRFLEGQGRPRNRVEGGTRRRGRRGNLNAWCQGCLNSHIIHYILSPRSSSLCLCFIIIHPHSAYVFTGHITRAKCNTL